MLHIGIDIGSTCAKIIVMNENKDIIYKNIKPTGWSSIDTGLQIKEDLIQDGINFDDATCVATGYGRVSVPFADKMVTEITCHSRGACSIFNCDDMTVIDIGGQDTKIITNENGLVKDFSMNDKCSAGTGRFLEIMANTMALKPMELCELARNGGGTTISSMCTVFAESEIISLIGRGEKKENIAFGVVNSIAEKVASQCGKKDFTNEKVVLTGGLCDCEFLKEILADKLISKIFSSPESRYAGAIGAALTGFNLKK